MNAATADFAAVGIAVTPGSYKLNVVNNYSTASAGQATNYISWQWPVGMLPVVQSGLFIWFIVIQYSQNASNLPSTSVVYTPGRNTPPVDANWTTIQNWSDATYRSQGYPQSFTHPWPTNQPVVYRMLVNVLGHIPNTDPVQNVNAEIGWGIPVLVVPVQTLNCRTDNGQPRLTWNVPDVSWWPTPG